MRVQDLRQVSIAVITVGLIIAAMLVPLPVDVSAAQVRNLKLDARAFAYAPASIDIHKGDTVRLTLEALDAAHGLSIDGYDVSIQAEPGKTGHATFVADKEGKFKFRCSISCGPLHPFMIGEMVVTPEFPFARASAATAIATLGAVILFWRRS